MPDNLGGSTIIEKTDVADRPVMTRDNQNDYQAYSPQEKIVMNKDGEIIIKKVRRSK